MNNIDKPFSFRTLFSEKFLVPQRDLGRRPDQSLTQEAQESFLSKKVEVYVNEIVIPKMQRDYAQGRPNEEEVRENFLQSLYDALVDDTGRKRCSLNFIYGHFLESQDNAGYVSFVRNHSENMPSPPTFPLGTIVPATAPINFRFLSHAASASESCSVLTPGRNIVVNVVDEKRVSYLNPRR